MKKISGRAVFPLILALVLLAGTVLLCIRYFAKADEWVTFSGSRSRSEIVATFLALLELCKLKSISIDAEDADGDMNVTYLRMPEETVAKE